MMLLGFCATAHAVCAGRGGKTGMPQTSQPCIMPSSIADMAFQDFRMFMCVSALRTLLCCGLPLRQRMLCVLQGESDTSVKGPMPTTSRYQVGPHPADLACAYQSSSMLDQACEASRMCLRREPGPLRDGASRPLSGGPYRPAAAHMRFPFCAHAADVGREKADSSS